MSTISDVAKLAGVSAGTVSRVMNGATNVTPETRQRVEQAIATLNYQPNFQARGLRSKRTDTIALAIPELTNYFWTALARGVQSAAQSSGYHVIICNTFERSLHNLRYLESIYSRVDGMILSRRSEWVVLKGQAAPTRSDDGLEKPLVFVGQSQAAEWNLDNVYSDSIAASFALTEHLIRLGRRTIGIVTGRQSSSSASDRVVGFCMALEDAELPIDPALICWGEYERSTAERLTHALLSRMPTTDAIVAANNEIAIGVMRALDALGKAVPDDVAVVCFDDFYPDSRYASFMTVASQSPYDMGINAAQLLLDRLSIDQGLHYLHPKTVVLPMRLIVRRSCGGTPDPVPAASSNPSYDQVHGRIVAPLSVEMVERLSPAAHPFAEASFRQPAVLLPQPDIIEITALRNTLRSGRPSSASIPHFEYAVSNRALYRYVLEREPSTEIVSGTALISPEDQVEFAVRSRIAAIACRFPYRPQLDNPLEEWSRNSSHLPLNFPRLVDQISFFERYVRAARGTSVAIAADFRSIVGDALRIFAELSSADPASKPDTLRQISESLSLYQSKVVQLICDRFRRELAFALFSDQWADEKGLRMSPTLFGSAFAEPIRTLIQPAKQHGLTAVLYTTGALDSAIPLIQRIGFDAVYVAQPELNDLAVLNRIADGALGFMGGIPFHALVDFREEAISEIGAAVAALPGTGARAVLGVVPEIGEDFPVSNYLALLRVFTKLNRFL